MSGVIPFPLYHGTSTLFLEGILEHGLGGRNPIAEWGVLDFAEALLPYVESRFSHHPELVMKVHSFGRMVRQEAGGWNFQHGDTYLSPSRDTAIRYATNKRCGSELLSYAVDFLQELMQREVPGVRDLYRRFPLMFGFLDISPAPLLIQMDGLPFDAIASAENGEDAVSEMKLALTTWEEQPDIFEILSQQSNFRLGVPQPRHSLRISLVNVLHWQPQGATCRLYPLQTEKCELHQEQ